MLKFSLAHVYDVLQVLREDGGLVGGPVVEDAVALQVAGEGVVRGRREVGPVE